MSTTESSSGFQAGSVETLYPIAVLIDELKHDEIQLRLNAIHKLPTIALALNEERTREELIPFLDENIDDEDEVLSALATELGNFVPYVGGPEYAHVLIRPLENLATIEEPLVREIATESLCKICSDFTHEQAQEYFVPMVERLAKGDWFTNRTSATALFACIYRKVDTLTQNSLRKLFSTLCADETPMVRRAAATNMKKFIAEFDAKALENDALPKFKQLAIDEQDSVRLLAVDVFIAFFSNQNINQGMQNILKQHLAEFFKDKSWRVRYMAADNFARIANLMPKEYVREEMLNYFVDLIKDIEQEVRTAIIGQISDFVKLLDSDLLLKEIIPEIKQLINDPSQHVRAASGLHISSLAPVLGKANSINYLLPIYLDLLKDSFHEVRLNIISKLDVLNNVTGINPLSQSLLPAITNLAEDKQWRVRLAIIEYIPLLASQLGTEFFDKKLSDLCVSWLSDDVYSIREATIITLRKLIEIFGVEWAKQAIMTNVLAMSGKLNYLFRMTFIRALSAFIPILDIEYVATEIMPLLEKLLEDPIANIRFNVAKAYEAIQRNMYKTVIGKKVLDEIIKPGLIKLSNDQDADVRYFANRAINS